MTDELHEAKNTPSPQHEQSPPQPIVGDDSPSAFAADEVISSPVSDEPKPVADETVTPEPGATLPVGLTKPEGQVESSKIESDDPETEAETDIEWDDTPTTLVMRTIFTLLAGGFLLWAQLHSPLRAGVEWGRWISLSVIANLLLPLGIVWMFFAQGVQRIPELKNQVQNAWNYGWDFRDWKTHLRWSLCMFVVLLIPLWLASRTPETRAYYAAYFPPITDANTALWLGATLILYMFCWEWFFRGFLLFGMAQGVGPIIAIVIQAALFGVAHHGKPMPEYYSSFVGGVVLGAVSWHQKSFAVAFYTHALLHLAWAVLVLM